MSLQNIANIHIIYVKKSRIEYLNDRMLQYLNTSIYVSIYDSLIFFLHLALLFLSSFLFIPVSKRHVAYGKNY